MRVLDGFKFWLGRTLAELFVILLFCAIVAAMFKLADRSDP